MPKTARRVTRRWALISTAFSALAGAALPGCGSAEDDTNAPPVTTPATLLGLSFSITGTVATTIDGALPAATAAFAGPVTSINQRPTPTASATISVAALEPFNTVLLLPGGATQYVRISLPSSTTLIGVNVIGVTGAATAATSVTVAVANNARVSQGTPLALQALGN